LLLTAIVQGNILKHIYLLSSVSEDDQFCSIPLCCYCSVDDADMLGYLWSYVYYVFLRRMLKWCLRILTGKCELQRITDARHAAAASRVFAVGQYAIT